MTAAATEYNARPAAQKTSKVVSAIAIDGATGKITVTSDTTTKAGLPTDARGKNLLFTPNVSGAALADGVTGAIDWACTSSTATTAAARGLTAAATDPMPAKYAPSECR